MNAAGKLYLIPCPLSEAALHTIPPATREIAGQLKYFFVENERSARRYLKALDRSIVIDELHFYLMNENHPPDITAAKVLLAAGENIGIISEAGCPAVADPGNVIVAAAQEAGARVIPLTGPNSILLALMASGMNGQNFQFTGYLPVKPPGRAGMIKELEALARQRNQTQAFIETPYRNNQLLRDIITHCKDLTLLCIAADITAPGEFIRTKTIREWKKELPDLHKRPTIFLLGSG